MQSLQFALLAIAAGVSFVLQQTVNSDLKASLGVASWAGFVSYLGGTICMVILAVILGDSLPTAPALLRTHWWAWSGGLFGAVYIAIAILSLARLGTASFVALFVAGQMLCSLAFDHFGLFGLSKQPTSPLRLLGALLVVGGVVLIRR